MCGIFGIAAKKDLTISPKQFKKTLLNLFINSESRGKESAGIHVYFPSSRKYWTLKESKTPSQFIKSRQFKQLWEFCSSRLFSHKNNNQLLESVIILGHSRLVTHGDSSKVENNQPVSVGNICLIHNGIIVNHEAIWKSNPDLIKMSELDTEVITALIDKYSNEDLLLLDAVKTSLACVEGSASIACINHRSSELVMATNTGDLCYTPLVNSDGLVFASESYILLNALHKKSKVMSVPASTVVEYDVYSGLISTSSLTKNILQKPTQSSPLAIPYYCNTAFDKKLIYNESRLASLVRCSKCILPETFPFIAFNKEGICNYCLSYQPSYAEYAGPSNTATIEFIKSLDRYRRSGASPDVIVPFSGGRDSSYGLHLLCKEYGFKPVTFTYDWGMVTDLARRNVARMCGSLGVQNILVSANIAQKREYIRKNIIAWLKKPSLGMIPLFMAGDKEFFKIVNNVKKQTSIGLNIWCANPLENTDFKSGFCGVKPDFNKERLDYLSFTRKLRLIRFFGKEFMTNRSYLNSSLSDSAKAFFSYYLEPRRDFYFLFNHLRWEESAVDQVLLNQYEWERSPDSSSTWRIGDGTAPFYNYIYCVARGFTEFDTFRSNQIREGMIDRETALQSVLNENRPRASSIRWYIDVLGLDFNAVINVINMLDELNLHS